MLHRVVRGTLVALGVPDGRLKALVDVECAAYLTALQLKSLSKMTSVARRFFKFMRWVKHYEDLAEAHEQKDLVMRTLLYIRIAANFGADWAEDVCSLERVGILSAGTLSMSFMLFAEYCQLVRTPWPEHDP